MTTGFRPRIGDAVLHQFINDWEVLSEKLHHLDTRKRMATTPVNDPAAMKEIERRVEQLSASFERRNELIEQLFTGEWKNHQDYEKLKNAAASISVVINRILKAGHPDRGRGSLGKVINDAQVKQELAQAGWKATEGKDEPMYTLPELPSPVAPNPILALAILLDLVRTLVLGKKKKDKNKRTT